MRTLGKLWQNENSSQDKEEFKGQSSSKLEIKGKQSILAYFPLIWEVELRVFMGKKLSFSKGRCCPKTLKERGKKKLKLEQYD